MKVHTVVAALTALLLSFGAVSSHATEAFIERYFESPKIVGESRLKVLFWNIYDAKLVSQEGVFNDDGPLALSLTYLRDFDGESIASRSIDEMRNQGFKDEVKLAAWFEQMKSLFPNVRKGQNITGIMDANGFSHFYMNGQHIGSIEDKTFSVKFFGIWLDENTSEPKMRLQLLGVES